MFYNEQFVFIKRNFCLLVLPHVLCHPLLTLNNVSWLVCILLSIVCFVSIKEDTSSFPGRFAT